MKSLLLCLIPATALFGGTITIFVTNNVNLSNAPAPNSLANYSGSADIGIPPAFDSQGFVPPSTLQPFVQATTASGTGQASSGGPTNLSQPLTLAADGQLNVDPLLCLCLAFEDSGYGFSVVPSGAVSNYILFPSIAINFFPDLTTGQAAVIASQETEAQNTGGPTIAQLQLQILFMGGGASFSLDPSTGAMRLITTPGGSGSIALTSLYSTPGQAPQSTSLIDFAFQSSGVTASSNTLGLALPSIGGSPDFDLSAVSPFQTTLPVIGPGDAPVVKEFSFIGQNASVDSTPPPVPEPQTLALVISAAAFMSVRIATKRLASKA